MMKAGMQCPRVNHISHAQLPYPAKALKPGMLDEVEKQGITHRNESVDRVIEYFSALER